MTEPSYLTTTRAAYDTIAVDYTEYVRDELALRPLGRAMLGAFAEVVRAADVGPAADIGCGPGRVSVHLQSLDLDVFGVDLSPKMVEIARSMYPDLRFEEGSMTALDQPDGSLGGIVAWYSIIHVPPESQPAVFAEFFRVLAPGGHLLLAFQVGDEQRNPGPLWQKLGHTVSYHSYRLPPSRVAGLLREAGFVAVGELVAEASSGEKSPQAYILVRKPGPEVTN
jgi:SAM-dependent methyltransferase